MNKYVIINNDNGKFVTPTGSKKSYTSALQNARIFSSYDDAKKNCCGNERVESISSILNI